MGQNPATTQEMNASSTCVRILEFDGDCDVDDEESRRHRRTIVIYVLMRHLHRSSYRIGPLSTDLVKRWRARRDLLSVAPMMDVTDRYFRYMMRLLTKRTRLYTEMFVDDTLLNAGDDFLNRFLDYEDVQHPVAVQLGGSDPEKLAAVAEICSDRKYDEINLNCGCPSSRVSKHMFGARLMLDPHRVRKICYAMIRRVGHKCPVTVKCRLGADDRDSYEELCEFVRIVASSGVHHFIVHARKCLLSGLSTKQNRSIPPLKYDWLRRLKRDFPDLRISLNGGVKTLDHAAELLGVPASPFAPVDDVSLPTHDFWALDSVMIGRGAWKAPWEFADADRRIFGEARNPTDGRSRRDVVREFVEVAEDRWDLGPRESLNVLKPVCSLLKGQPGSALFRRFVHREASKGTRSDLSKLIEEGFCLMDSGA